jgi:hypothetical protein
VARNNNFDFAAELRKAASEVPAGSAAAGLEAIFAEEPVPLTVFVQDQKFLANPPLSEVQYDAVRHIERIYYQATYPQLAEEFETGKRQGRLHIASASAVWREEKYWTAPLRMTNFATLQWGKGSGKDHICRVASMRIAYLLMCLHSPQIYYGMPEQDTIHLLNVASSSGQAQQAFFMPIVRAVKKGWFADKCQPKQNVVSYHKNIESVSGHSDAETQEGLNLLLAIADEIDAFKSKKEMVVRKGASAREPTKSAEGILNMMRTSSSPQPLDALVLTPDRGYVRMGDIRVGDRVVDPEENFESVVEAIYPQGVQPVYKLVFSDLTEAEATGSHYWVMDKLRSPRTVRERLQKSTEVSRELWTTDQLREHVQMSSYRHHRLRLPASSLDHVDLGTAGVDRPVDAYLLGLLLGDGGLTRTTPHYTTADPQLAEACEAALPPGVRMVWAGSRSEGCHSYRLSNRQGLLNPLTLALKSIGVWGLGHADKFVPDVYKLAPAAIRLAVLQGLMDTDGSSKGGYGTFSSSSRQLRDDVSWLARSLGLRARERDYPQTGKGTMHVWGVSISETEDVRIFRLRRKLGPIRAGKNRAPRSLMAVEYSRHAETQCIAVSAPSRLYVTNDFVTTHNTRFPEVFKNVRISYPRYLGSTIQQLTDAARADFEERGKLSRHYVSGPMSTWEVNPRVKGREAFAEDYREDPIMARAKYECRPARAVNPYFRNVQAVDASFVMVEQMPLSVSYAMEKSDRTDRRVWVPTYQFSDALFPVRGAIYTMHADLAVAGDRAGIAMAHVVDYNEYETITEDEDGAPYTLRETRPKVKVDFVVSYTADQSVEPPREIQIRWARQLCFELIRRGFNIRLFSFDSFQSTDSMQILEARGIDTEKISTDLSEDPWRNLRDLMYEGRIEIPRLSVSGLTSKAVPFLLREELLGLSRLPNGRVDHPADLSKDEADALACAAMTAVQLGGREEGAGERRYYEPDTFSTGGKADLPFGLASLRGVWTNSYSPF